MISRSGQTSIPTLFLLLSALLMSITYGYFNGYQRYIPVRNSELLPPLAEWKSLGKAKVPTRVLRAYGTVYVEEVVSKGTWQMQAARVHLVGRKSAEQKWQFNNPVEIFSETRTRSFRFT